MGKFQGESGVDADNHTLYIIHNAMISFVNAVSGKELFIPLSNTDESEGCDRSTLPSGIIFLWPEDTLSHFL